MARPRARGWLIAGLLAAALLACQDQAAKIADHQSRGEAYLQKKQWAEAAIEFKNVLQLDPNRADAHYGLAKAYMGQKNARSAYWELEETVRLDPKNVEARLQDGQFLLYGKKDDLERAVKSADAILAMDPKRWEAHVLKARALDALGRGDEAGAAYAAAVAAAPKLPAPLLLEANHLRAVGHNEKAEAAYRHLTEIGEGFAPWAAYGGFLAGLKGRDAEAEAAYRKGLEQAKPEERTAATTVLANFLMSRDRPAEAEAELKQALAKSPDDEKLIYTLARFYHSQGRTSEADAMIQEATRARPKDPKPLLLLSSYRGRIGDLNGALDAAEKALALEPGNELARLRKAELLVDIGYRSKDPRKVSQGRAIVDAILSKEESNPQALFVRAKIALADSRSGKPGRVADAVTALRHALDTRPDWAQAHFLMATALFVQGQRPQARAEAVRSLELDANLVDARILLARIDAALGDHNLAVEVGKRALKQRDDPQVRILVAQSLVRQGQLHDALTMLQGIPEQKRREDAHYALGRVYTLLNEPAKARGELEQAQKLSPAHADILRSLLALDVREGRLAESAARIEAAVKQKPDDAKLRQLQGEVAMFQGRSSDAEKDFRHAIDLDPNDLASYDLLARYLAAAKRPNEVLGTYERALAANPKSGPLNLVVGSLYEAQGQVDKAMQRYEEAIRLNPDLAVAKNNLAYLLADRGENLDRALDLAQDAKGRLPDNPNAADTLGWVLYKKNVPGAAVSYLKEAVNGLSAGDRNLPLVRQHLALAYEANHQRGQAVEQLQKALDEVAKLTAPKEKGQPASPEPPWVQGIRKDLARLQKAS